VRFSERGWMKKQMFIFAVLSLSALLNTVFAEPDPSVPRPRPAARNVIPQVAQTGPDGVLLKKEGVSPGFVLLAPRGLNSTFLVDENGLVMHEWTHSLPTAVAAYLLPNGNLLHTVVDGVGVDRDVWLEELSWTGEPVWRFSMKGVGAQIHHDIERLPNGNTLVIAAEFKSPADCLAAGRKREFLPERDLRVDGIYELRPQGPGGAEIVWSWSAWDHLDQIDINQTAPGKQRAPDWLHLNSVDYNAEQDEVMVCSRSLSEVWVISRKSGKLVRRWGNPQVHGEGTAADQTLFYHHDAHWIEEGLPGAGNILLFNNGMDRPEGAFSTVMEFKPANGKPALVWEYPPPEGERFFSRILSGAQRLPNGNTLICAGLGGTVFEVNGKNETVWKYINPFVPDQAAFAGRERYKAPSNNMLFRALKYPPDYPAFAENRLLRNEQAGVSVP